MQNVRKHYFPVQDGYVITGLCQSGEYVAYQQDGNDEFVRGYGHSRLAAIADLVEKLGATED